DADQVNAAVTGATNDVGRIDVLVNNAGIPTAAATLGPKFRSSTPDDWHPAIDLNLYGVMNCCHAVVGGMCERRSGSIVIISSRAATEGLNFGLHSYAAGKGGALSFMRHLAMEVAGEQVTVNALVLGLMDTAADFMSAKTIPIGRFGSGRDVGLACVWL